MWVYVSLKDDNTPEEWIIFQANQSKPSRRFLGLWSISAICQTTDHPHLLIVFRVGSGDPFEYQSAIRLSQIHLTNSWIWSSCKIMGVPQFFHCFSEFFPSKIMTKEPHPTSIARLAVATACASSKTEGSPGASPNTCNKPWRLPGWENPSIFYRIAAANSCVLMIIIYDNHVVGLGPSRI